MVNKPVRERVAERVRPLLPPVVTPTEKPSPYAGLATGPYAHLSTSPYDKISPYAGLSQAASPYAKLDPYAGLANPYERARLRATARVPRAPFRIVRHHIVVPPFGLPPLAPSWSLPLVIVSDAYEFDGLLSPLSPGWGVDFTDVGQALASVESCEHGEHCGQQSTLFAYHLSELLRDLRIDPAEHQRDYEDAVEMAWQQAFENHAHSPWALPIEPGSRPYTDWADTLMAGSYELGAEADWPRVLRLWAQAREQILSTPRDQLLGGCAMYAHQALVAAGYDFEDGFYAGNSTAEMLVENLDSDASLRAAFPDYVIQAELDLFFTLGTRPSAPVDVSELYQAVDELGEDAGVARIGDCQLPVFGQLWKPAPTRADRESLHGRYLCTRAVYHSLIEEPDDQAPEGMVGWRELHMLPCDQDWEPVDG